MSALGLLPWRRVLPAAQPAGLVRESEHAAARARNARITAAGRDSRSSGTWGWPDPHGPDPVVFGPWPRVKPSDD